MADIFLSYSTADRERVRPIVRALESLRYTVFWDRQIKPGERWDVVIEGELKSARCVVVVWSQNSISSEWVRAEAYEGRTRNVLIPVMIDDVARDIPLAFRLVQTANLTDIESVGLSSQPTFRQIEQRLQELIGSPRAKRALIKGKRLLDVTVAMRPRKSKLLQGKRPRTRFDSSPAKHLIRQDESSLRPNSITSDSTAISTAMSSISDPALPLSLSVTETARLSGNAPGAPLLREDADTHQESDTPILYAQKTNSPLAGQPSKPQRKGRVWRIGVFSLGAFLLAGGFKICTWALEPASGEPQISQEQPKPQAPPETLSPQPTQAESAGQHEYATYIRQGKAAFSGRKYQAAESAYRTALQINPKSPEAKEGLATSLVLGRADLPSNNEAAKLLQEVVANDRFNARSWFMLGLALQVTRKEDEAIEAYRQYLFLEPGGRFATDARIALKQLGEQP